MIAVNDSDSGFFSQTADEGGLSIRLAESVIDRMNVQIMPIP